LKLCSFINVELLWEKHQFCTEIRRSRGPKSVPQSKSRPLQHQGFRRPRLGDLRNQKVHNYLFLKKNFMDLKTVDGQLS
jgi:hypothetical protein